MMVITCNGFKYFYNKIIHKVDFEEAAECMYSSQAIVVFDSAHSVIEDRYNLISISPSGRILIVGFCKRQQNREARIISARVAPKKARKEYESLHPGAVFKSITHATPLKIAKLRVWGDLIIGVPLWTLEVIFVISKYFRKWLYNK